ncbi:MAG: twin-arginine translocase subunit TatC [candidate division Zixibacteria bacterium]|nr:twin-arginine translocase subunit TatC [candidate division Zixibacteria bacterium]
MTEPTNQPDDQKKDLKGVLEEHSMPFLVHLEELRRRLIKAFLGIILGAAAAFYFSPEIMEFIKLPLARLDIEGVELHNMQVTGTFYAYLKISLLTGVVVALPWVFYQTWAFISPGLYQREKIMVLPLVITSTILFLVGAGFCYVVVLPIALGFLLGFAADQITNVITISSYISFAGLLLLAFGFGFQMPIMAYFLGKFGIVSSKFLAKGRRYAFVIILIVGAIITPPDPLTQILLAVPLYLLYEISIIVVRLTGKRQ